MEGSIDGWINNFIDQLRPKPKWTAVKLHITGQLSIPDKHYRTVVKIHIASKIIVPRANVASSKRAEQCSEHSRVWSGHVAKIGMLRLNIGSDMLRLIS